MSSLYGSPWLLSSLGDSCICSRIRNERLDFLATAIVVTIDQFQFETAAFSCPRPLRFSPRWAKRLKPLWPFFYVNLVEYFNNNARRTASISNRILSFSAPYFLALLIHCFFFSRRVVKVAFLFCCSYFPIGLDLIFFWETRILSNVSHVNGTVHTFDPIPSIGTWHQLTCRRGRAHFFFVSPLLAGGNRMPAHLKISLSIFLPLSSLFLIFFCIIYFFLFRWFRVVDIPTYSNFDNQLIRSFPSLGCTVYFTL